LDQTLRRFSRVSVGRLDADHIRDLVVTAYGTQMPVHQLATVKRLSGISVSVEPWDKQLLKPLVDAILQGNENLNLRTQGQTAIFTAPLVTGTERKAAIKVVATLAEDGRNALRRVRRKYRRMGKEIPSADEEQRYLKQVEACVDLAFETLEYKLKLKEKQLSPVSLI